MKIAVVDDMEKEINLISSYLKKYEEEIGTKIVITTFCSPMEFLESYQGDFDLILLDVEMPGINGIETAKEIRKVDCRVVIMFITNMSQYALSGYEVEAVDYVIKPVTYADFRLKMEKACRYIVRNEEKSLIISTQEGVEKIHISDLFYVEVNKHYLIYHGSQGTYTARGSMKEAEEVLKNHYFVRCNNCYLVNLKYVQSIHGNDLTVAGETLSVSRSKKAELLNAFARYLGGM